MGITHVTTTIRSLSTEGTPYEADFLVDTGALDCHAPTSSLEAAGVSPETKRTYELADGQLVEYEVGFARLSLLGQETVVQVIFGPEKAEPILGVLALEALGIVVDPVSQSLKRLSALPLK
ncbi:MAG: aspartyl protease family protein [Planctomycetota bacterium]